MEKKDFIQTESCTPRLRSAGARKVTDAVNAWRNKTVQYHGNDVAWRYVMLLKGRELAHSLTGKKGYLDVLKPECRIAHQDSEDVRRKICSISYAE